MMGSLAVVRSLEPYPGVSDLEIKWPNDVLGKFRRKIAGCLAQYCSGGGGSSPGPAVILGTGININHQDDEFPRELSSKATSCLMECGKKISPHLVIAGYLSALDRLYRMVLEGGESELLRMWSAYSRSHVGCPVLVDVDHGQKEGLTDGINPDGSLRVILEGNLGVDVRAGEIILLGDPNSEG